MSDKQNEAELQAQLRQRIQEALPLLPANFQLEHYVHLKLGHKGITIDGSSDDRATVMGRYDMLVRVDDKPLLIVELKSPTVAIHDEDVKQGISYARLHTPIVPLVMVTNGGHTKLISTYTEDELDPNDAFANLLSKTLEAAALAATAERDAIGVLLASSQATWHSLLADWTAEQVQSITGEVNDFRFPIADNFQIPRTVVDAISTALAEGQEVQVLHGPPLSGITNALTQVALLDNVGPVLFVESESVPDVFQFIADKLSRELYYSVTKDELRGWLNKKKPLAGLVLVLDGTPENLIDLLHFARQGALQLVIGMTTDAFQEASVIKKGRKQSSLLGKTAMDHLLEPLSDAEFESAKNVLLTEHDAVFSHGAEHNPDLRFARALRVRAAFVPTPQKQSQALTTADTRRVLSLNPITGIEELRRLTRLFALDAEMRHLLQSLTRAFLKEASAQHSRPTWLTATYGYPSVDAKKVRKDLKKYELTQLQDAGFISWFVAGELGSRLLVRIEELLALVVALEWTDELASYSDEASTVSKIERLISLLRSVPLGEVTLALAIESAADSSPEVLGAAINYLMEQEPVSVPISVGSRVQVLSKDAKPIVIEVDESMESPAIDNMSPWIVLSYLAARPLVPLNGGDSYNLEIFKRVGASPLVLYSPQPSHIAKVQSLCLHELRGGMMVCWENGIVEPITQALVTHLRFLPVEFDLLVQWCIENDSPFLGWRVLTAARVLSNNASQPIRVAAEEAYEKLKGWLMTDGLH